MRTRESDPYTGSRSVSRWSKSGGWAALCLAVTMASVPTDVTAQVGACWVCVRSEFPDTSPFSTMCTLDLIGRTYCSSQGTKEFHVCLPFGPVCVSGVTGAADELAVASVRAGVTLPIDSDYLVVAEAGDILVMRRCGAEVARFTMSERGAKRRAGGLAMNPADRLEHPEVGVTSTASGPRKQASEQ